MKLVILNIVLVLLLTATGCTTSIKDETAGSTDDIPAMGIYLPIDRPRYPIISPIDIESVKLEDSPIIGIDNIWRYHQETHQFELKPDAMQRLGMSLTGVPFVLCVGRDRIFSGSFYHPVSSYIAPGMVIQLPLLAEEHSVWIGKMLYDDGADPLSDSRFLDALQEAGKLN